MPISTFHSQKNQNLGIGLGLRSQHYGEIRETLPNLPWFEAISENYMGIEGRDAANPLRILREIRKDYEIVLHGVSLSIGSTDTLNEAYLRKLSALIAELQPAWISDHLCWTGVGGENLHDLLPLPYTEEALHHVSERVMRVQEKLGRRMLLENVSSYLTYTHSTMTEWEFLSEVAQRADCGLLLDINNIYVSAINHKFDPLKFIRAMPSARIGQIHLAGHSQGENLLIDTHDHPVCDEVWGLYQEALKILGPTPTLIEWDANIPSFSRLSEEASRARSLYDSVLSPPAVIHV